jgi:hypothetical protein
VDSTWIEVAARWDQKERYRVLARLRLGDVADRFPMLDVACDR